jgi:hypothetical protein
MKILMTSMDMAELGGTQTWTATMAKEIASLGHDIFFRTARTGKFYFDILSRYGTAVLNDLKGYDLILCNHQRMFPHLKDRGNIPLLVTSHGPEHRMEKMFKGADYYFCVSEEIQKLYPKVKPTLARQPIDLGKFLKGNGSGKVLVMPKSAEAVATASAACEEAGLDYDVVHYKLNPKEDMWNAMPNYRVVITAGRGAVEAMACGCQVLIYQGNNRCDGWATSGNVSALSRTNYSGRSFDFKPSLKESLSNIPNENMRPWVEENHDAKGIAKKYLAYA